jgi:hypothetical protein
MVEFRTRTARRNLREGIKKMEKTMSAAAQVRRDFRLGRPPKPGETLPLHRMVVWQRAAEALANFRTRMAAAELNPNDAGAVIVYVETSNPDLPHFLELECPGKTPEESKLAAFEVLGRDDVIALGMLFGQFDEQAKKQAIFPYQFVGLNERGLSVLRSAGLLQHAAIALTKTKN